MNWRLRAFVLRWLHRRRRSDWTACRRCGEPIIVQGRAQIDVSNWMSGAFYMHVCDEVMAWQLRKAREKSQ